MTFNQKAIVYIFLEGDGYTPAGTLEFYPTEDRCSFRYGKKYLARSNALPLDPVKLPLLDMYFYTEREQAIFNVFRDAAPDKWGRRVISVMAGMKAETMTEFEVLTALHPQCRIGAIAFGEDPHSGPKSLASWYKGDVLIKSSDDLAEIARYVRLVDEIEDEDLETFRETLPSNDFLKALATSLSPVGGARPKALVRYENKDWIAKFPKRGDIWNEPLIEHACMTMAGQCGIWIPETKIVNSNNVDVLLVERFDRDASGNPRHFASGFTIGDIQEDGHWKSYQHLAASARYLGAANIGEQIFRRMVFNILVANTDDHPRNHAFFIYGNRIELTPAYDIVPCRLRLNYELALRCGKYGNIASLENALSDTGPFGLTLEESKAIILDMQQTIQAWPIIFDKLGVNKADINELDFRFSHCEYISKDDSDFEI